MDQYTIFAIGIIVGMIVMSVIVVGCNLDNIKEVKKQDKALDGIIYLDPWEEIVRVGENKYMIKIKSRR